MRGPTQRRAEQRGPGAAPRAGRVSRRVLHVALSALAIGTLLLSIDSSVRARVGPRSMQPGRQRTVRERLARTPHVYAQPASVTTSVGTFVPISFDGHVHTRHSPDAVTDPHALLALAHRLGLDAILFTDHGSTRAAGEVVGDMVLSAPGQEIGGQFGHAVMWNTQPPASTTRAFRTSLAQRSAFAHDNGGLIVLAHPGWWIRGNRQDPAGWITPEAIVSGGRSADIDAVEIWNGVYSVPTRKLVDAWVHLLDLGIYVPVVGGSDFHNARIHRLGHPRNVALCKTRDIAGVLEAAKHGHLYITDGPSLVFTANDALPGDVVSGQPGDPIHITLEVVAPEGGTLLVFVGHDEYKRIELDPKGKTTETLELPMPAQDSYLRVEVEQLPGHRRGGTAVGLLSNPILLDALPARTSWR
jgi:hypothetical protein